MVSYHSSLLLYLAADSISKTRIKVRGELSWTYQQWAGVITKLSQHSNDDSCEDDKTK